MRFAPRGSAGSDRRLDTVVAYTSALGAERVLALRVGDRAIQVNRPEGTRFRPGPRPLSLDALPDGAATVDEPSAGSATPARSLAKLPFRGRTVVFLLILPTPMIPFETIMIPLYVVAFGIFWRAVPPNVLPATAVVDVPTLQGQWHDLI